MFTHYWFYKSCIAHSPSSSCTMYSLFLLFTTYPVHFNPSLLVQLRLSNTFKLIFKVLSELSVVLKFMSGFHSLLRWYKTIFFCSTQHHLFSTGNSLFCKVLKLSHQMTPIYFLFCFCFSLGNTVEIMPTKHHQPVKMYFCSMLLILCNTMYKLLLEYWKRIQFGPFSNVMQVCVCVCGCRKAIVLNFSSLNGFISSHSVRVYERTNGMNLRGRCEAKKKKQSIRNIISNIWANWRESVQKFCWTVKKSTNSTYMYFD